MAQGQTRPDKARQGRARPDKAAHAETSTIFHTRKSVVSYVRKLFRGICTGCCARPDKARQGRARPDKAAHAETSTIFHTRKSVVSYVRQLLLGICTGCGARPDKARQGQTRPDKARQGQTRPDKARQGQTRPDKARQGHDKARQGQTRPRKARQGQTRPDKARQGQTRPHKATHTAAHAETPAHGAPVLDAVPVGSAAYVVYLDSVDHFHSQRCRTSVYRISRYGITPHGEELLPVSVMVPRAVANENDKVRTGFWYTLLPFQRPCLS